LDWENLIRLGKNQYLASSKAFDLLYGYKFGQSEWFK